MSRGEFPRIWKEALLTPVLKKGDPNTKENYRPVSCLPAASKLLESMSPVSPVFHTEVTATSTSRGG